MDCVFCKIIKKEISSKILYEDEDLIIILDAYPDAEGHTLIIPKKHIEDFTKMPEDLLLKINSKAIEYSKILMEKLDKKAITTLVNYGDAQVIKHYHMHLLPDMINKPIKTQEEVYTLIMNK